MSQPPAKTALSEADFEAIAAAVQETERGRWFLTEYARRNRHSDTQQVLEAIERLQRSMGERTDASPSESIRSTIADMSDAIARTKAEIAAIQPDNEGFGKIADATIELDAIVATTEKATSEILAGAEKVQEIAWTLREAGLDPVVCDQLDALMTETYTACSFQDLTGQRIGKIINVLHFLEARVEAMKLIWGRHEVEAAASETPAMEPQLLHGPALPGEGLEQDNIDGILGEQPAPASMFAPEPEIEATETAAVRTEVGIESRTEGEAPVAEDDVFWEDSPVDGDTSQVARTEAAMEAAARLIAENIAAKRDENDVPPLVPAVSGADLMKTKFSSPPAAPIEQLSAAGKLALFS